MKDLSELNISELLNETYTTTPIQADKKTADGAVVTVIMMSIANIEESIVRLESKLHLEPPYSFWCSPYH